MHNELFNPIDIFTYHPGFRHGSSMGDEDAGDQNLQQVVPISNKPRWSVLTRDLFPAEFLDFIWTGKNMDGNLIKPHFKAVG
eukprot:CAMPEP_0172467900 /NCGR_PEP_ID=MMETSP1065-20121228/60113_1 /TAXON_ID=265537 /ORGANISM="Amphiprora paludosa, Strain CCMP125" /LENGTH=81 /DNA_ID=CAMNT_0013225163 /DNA_START=198 /DNA_END=439 /DNA_ORIENTATION=-